MCSGRSNSSTTIRAFEPTYVEYLRSPTHRERPVYPPYRGPTTPVTLRFERNATASRHEFVETGNLVIGDAGQRVSEPGLRIDAVEFGRFDQRVGDGC